MEVSVDDPYFVPLLLLGLITLIAIVFIVAAGHLPASGDYICKDDEDPVYYIPIIF